MRTLLVCGFVALLSVLTLAQPVNWVRVTRDTSIHVARYEARVIGMKGIGVGQCTVILVGDNAHGITAGHCVQHPDGTVLFLSVDGRPAVVVASEFEPFAEANDMSLDMNWGKDIAYLSFAAIPGKRPIQLCRAKLRKGQPIAIFGYPFGIREVSGQYGYIGIPYLAPAHRIIINGDIMPADSGGPIVAEDGHLVGMSVNIAAMGPSHLTLGVSLDYIRDFLKRASKR